MAKKARAAAAIPNTANPETVNKLLDRWDAIQEEKASDLGSYRSKCKGHKESEAAIFTEAEARGVPPKLLRKDIKIRALERSIREIESTVEEDEFADWEAICKATEDRDTKKPTEADQAKASDKAANKQAFDDFAEND